MHNLIETLSGRSNYAKLLSTASEHKLCVGKLIEFFFWEEKRIIYKDMANEQLRLIFAIRSFTYRTFCYE